MTTKVDKMDSIIALQDAIVQFTKDRDWDQFHNGKDLALALGIEVGELQECFLWKDPTKVKKEKIAEELGDVFNYAFLMADKYGLDVDAIVRAKLAVNAAKYPVEKAKGSAKKYTEL